VLVNVPPSFRADFMPYGGVKDSGQGREGVKYAIAELVEQKLVILRS
jgi:acyl-CoA reductase-like NAD-dependent aldehyde dehydrogenase